MRRHRLLAIILCLLLLSAPWPASAASPETRAPLDGKEPTASPGLTRVPLEARRKIAPDLLKQLLEAERRLPRQGTGSTLHTTYLVHLRENASLEDLMASPDRQERRERLVERLQSTARRSQAGLVSYLEQQLEEGSISRYQSYWIFNGLAVDGDLETAIQLALRPEVASIRPNRVHHLPAPETKIAESSLEPEWGVARIKADRVWSEFGITGVGIVVANIDSGVDWTHPALQSKYRGYNAANPSASTHDYNWIDLTDTYPNAPGPTQGHVTTISDHGTHTMGTMVGSDPTGGKAIGVAPGAKWIAVKAFNDQGDATDENIHAGFQWCLAPTDLHGANPDPSKAPDIVNNSWGDDNGTDETFRQDAAVMRAAGILCTFSAGNAGPNSGTVGSPASFPEAFSVGAIDSADGIASFSARGPSPWGEIKPEVVAPGVSINSAIAGGTYESWNGTSMAAPHVAGLAALVLQAARMAQSGVSALQRNEGTGLTITATERIITSTARNLGAPGADNIYGFGCVDAYQAVGAVVQSGTFAGRVMDGATDAPLAGALIIMRNLATGGQASTQTQADGSYSFAVAQGSYDVTASKFGYQDALVQNVQVLANTTTQLDFPLVALPSGIIRGRVTRATNQQPVPAVVRLAGAVGEALVDSQGYYSFSVPAGTYSVRAVATAPGYRGSERQNVTVAVGDVLTLDFTLTPAPRILLVDADAWASSSAIGYYQSALDNLLYSYDTWAIADFPADNPSADELVQHELVIWAQPNTSPGYIGAWSELATYLDQGRRLLISGEDVGYWDYQGEAAASYRDYLHATYLQDDGGLIPILGLSGEILDGVRLEFNTADSARNQAAPDVVARADALAYRVIASHPETVFGLRADACTHRVVYLSFGFEGVGPQAAREQALARAIAWLAADRPSRGVGLSLSIASQVGALGDTIIYDLLLVNESKSNERFRVWAESPTFSLRLVNASTGQPVTETSEMTPCATVPLRLLVTIPQTATIGGTEICTIRAACSSSAQISATQSVRTVVLTPWTQVTGLPTPRYGLGSAVRDCTIYTFGGLLDDDEGTIANVVELLDLRSGTWTTGTPKPTPAADYATAQFGDQVYLIGGWNSDAPGQFLLPVGKNVAEEFQDITARYPVAYCH